MLKKESNSLHKSIRFTLSIPLCFYLLSLPAFATTSIVSGGYLIELLDDLPEQYENQKIEDINASGQIAGAADGDAGVRVEQAVTWNVDATITNLDGNVSELYSHAYGINDAGHIVGHFEERPVIWVNGQMTHIRNDQDSLFFARATDINNNGTVIGTNGFILQNNMYSELETLAGLNITPIALNENDQVTGYSFSSTGANDSRAAIWINDLINILDTPAEVANSRTTDINDNGTVTGYVNHGDPLINLPVAWFNGGMQYLAPTGITGKAHSLNNSGQIVGQIKNNSNNHAFVWQDGVMTDLSPLLQGICPTSEPCSTIATVVNDAGQIAGSFIIPGVAGTANFRSQLRAFKMTPVSSNNSNIDLVTSMTTSADTLQVGENINYSVNVVNNGSATSTGVNLNGILPVGLNLISATSSTGVCSGLSTITCMLSDLAANTSAQINITAIAEQSGSFTFSLTAYGNEAETNNSNNTASHTLVVTEPAPMPEPMEADLRVRISDSPDPAYVGEQLIYTIRITNHGPTAAKDVELLDKLSPDVDLLQVESSAGSCSGNQQIVCYIGLMPANTSQIVTITVTPLDRGRIRNSAVVSSATFDPNESNNKKRIRTRIRN